MLVLAIDTATADLIVGVAAYNGEVDPSGATIDVLAESVMTCLLYTSPSPRD